MLVPKFTLDQTPETLTMKIHSPYTNVEDTEVYVDDHEFVFSSPPYHLRLNLPGKIVEDGKSCGKYDCDSGYYTFTFGKVNKGEYFENLDMITSLMAPKVMSDLTPELIEIVNSEENDCGILESSETPPLPNGDISFTNHSFAYGFANKLKGNFKDLSGEFPNIFELKTPEEISYDDRKKLMEEHETNKFSCDHYLADYFEEDLVQPLLNYKAPWENIDEDTPLLFTPEEMDVLKNLPNKEYLLTKDEYDKVTYNLVDVIYGYCYEKRVTANENTIESSWTINRISGTLSWFAVFYNLKEALVSGYRRSLIYPIYRNFELSSKVQKDVEQVFKIGRKYVIKCLIEIYQLFNLSQDARYILNQLYVKDFLIFSQKCDESTYIALCNQIHDIVIEKDDLKLDLEEFEEAGRLVQLEEAQIVENTMAMHLAAVKLASDEEKFNPTVQEVESESSIYTSNSSSSSSSELDSDDDSDSS